MMSEVYKSEFIGGRMFAFLGVKASQTKKAIDASNKSTPRFVTGRNLNPQFWFGRNGE